MAVVASSWCFYLGYESVVLIATPMTAPLEWVKWINKKKEEFMCFFYWSTIDPTNQPFPYIYLLFVCMYVCTSNYISFQSKKRSCIGWMVKKEYIIQI